MKLYKLVENGKQLCDIIDWGDCVVVKWILGEIRSVVIHKCIEDVYTLHETGEREIILYKNVM